MAGAAGESGDAAKGSFTLYAAETPNGIKIPVALEVAGAPYQLKMINLKENEQKADWYLKINPNGRIPAIRHHGAGPKGEDVDVFESGAILEYIAEAFPEGGAKLLPKEEPARSATRGWLHWQMGGLGPMMGQAFHFMFKKPKVEYAFERYTDESKRLLGILDKRVGESEWLNGSSFSLAECAILPWVAGALKPERAEMAETMFGISAFKNLPKWVERCQAIEAVGKGLGALSANKEGEGEREGEGK